PYPDRHDLDIHASMDPAKEVGGDFYDFFLIDHDHLGLVMADVAGKGIPAALFMMMARIMINYSAKTGVPPAEVLRRVNERICENNEAEMFVTVWLGILDMNTGEVVAANAGHEYPMLRGAKGDFVLRKDPHGFVVGGMEGVKFRDYRFTLERGGTLFLYTDGLPEANNAKGKLFGTDRVLEVLNANPDASAEQLLDAMTKAVAKYVGKTEQFDDLTMMAVRLLDLPEDSKETQNVVEPGEKDHKK
ncbi:MAG: serine/threonine-protein phosphatase, partial [Oscillospiraceae bacterium]|nr:serine/threonine-protein phosphatase [Oscillospiraceae bacterium]